MNDTIAALIDERAENNQIRGLATAEIEEVSGGVIPLVLIAVAGGAIMGIAGAAAINKFAEWWVYD
ncbi:MAG: class IIb bacteriocin, lactobin A/cerein 7B family [Hyphomicrobiaceae bacterium]